MLRPKYLGHVTGYFCKSFVFCCQVKLFISFSEYSTPSFSFASILKRSVHLVSAADNDINQAGKGSCLIIAKASFFLLPNKQVNSEVGEIYNSPHQV